MIRFLSIKITGFCSIVDTFQLNLNQGCTILIKAPNGNGKSTVFSALVWALYGKNIKGVSEVNTWSSIQPKDYKGTLVEVFFQKDSMVYKVVRCQNYTDTIDDGAKGKDRLLVIKDTEPVDIKGKNNLQEYINQELGLSYSLFMNSIMFGQGMKRLIQESNSDKKALFEEIFSLSFINVARGIAVDEREAILKEASSVDHDIRRIQTEIDSTDKAYHDTRELELNFEKSLSKKRKELVSDREMLTKRLIEVQKHFSEELESQLKVKETKRLKVISELEAKLKEAKQVSNIPILELADKVYTLVRTKKYKEALSWLKKLKVAIGSIDNLRDEVSNEKDLLASVREAISELNTYKRKAEDICDDIASVDRELSLLDKEKPKVVSNKYRRRLRELKTELKVLTSRKDNISSRLDDYNWVINDPLGNNGIKAYLFDSSLNMVNESLSRYSDILGFKVEFSIDLSTARKEFVTLIERDGHIIEYEELSGGERQVCNIAMAFAMNEALTSSKGINIAFLDEVFESLSQDNIELIISLINSIFEGKTLFLITHHDSLPLSKSKVLQVDKINGRSNYKVL